MQTHPEQYEKGGDHIKYIDLSKYVNPKQENEMNNFQPDFSHQKYLEIREEVLQAEQHQLRVIDFDARNEHKKGYQMMLIYQEYLDWDTTAIQLALSIFNDLVFQEVNKFQHSNSEEFLQKTRKYIFAGQNTAYIVGDKLLGIRYDNKIDDEFLDKFFIDKAENNALTLKILEKYDELYNCH